MGEGVQVGQVVPGGVHIRQGLLEAPPYAAPPPVLGQGGHAADAAHLAGVPVKADGVVVDDEAAHRPSGIQRDPPAGGGGNAYDGGHPGGGCLLGG